MEGIQSTGNSAQGSSLYFSAKLELNAVVIEKTLSGADSVDFSGSELYKGLTGTAKSIVDKINELLKAKLPNGVQSLNPEEVTAEATADRIVKGATGLFEVYAKQNPDLEGEELLASFIDKVQSGITKGYDDAYSTLEGLGAFAFEGVREGVEKTKVLIEAKLKEFEASKRKELGLDTAAPNVATDTRNSLLAGAGSKLNLVA